MSRERTNVKQRELGMTPRIHPVLAYLALSWLHCWTQPKRWNWTWEPWMEPWWIDHSTLTLPFCSALLSPTFGSPIQYGANRQKEGVWTISHTSFICIPNFAIVIAIDVTLATQSRCVNAGDKGVAVERGGHVEDDLPLSRNFRTARCCALFPELQQPVPWGRLAAHQEPPRLPFVWWGLGP